MHLQSVANCYHSFFFETFPWHSDHLQASFWGAITPILRTYDLGGAVLELGMARIHCLPGQRDGFRGKWPTKPDHWDPEGQTWDLYWSSLQRRFLPEKASCEWCKSETAGGPFHLRTQGTCQCRERQSPGQTDRGRSRVLTMLGEISDPVKSGVLDISDIWANKSLFGSCWLF